MASEKAVEDLSRVIGAVRCDSSAPVNYEGIISTLVASELEAILPATFFADRTVVERVERIVDGWRRAVVANQALESKLAPPQPRPKCLACGGTNFLRGPEGGLSQNIQCVKCGNRWNVSVPGFPLEWIGHKSDDQEAPTQAELDATQEAERIAPCAKLTEHIHNCFVGATGETIHSVRCPAFLRPAIAAALTAERERCARIVEDRGDDQSWVEPVAAAIRGGK
jgi:hypothetical protein